MKEMMEQLETANKISVEDERAGLADPCPVMIKFITGSAALHYKAVRGGHNKAAFPVRNRNRIQCDKDAA